MQVSLRQKEKNNNWVNYLYEEFVKLLFLIRYNLNENIVIYFLFDLLTKF